ncbi:MAG: hypothetical protein EOP51_09965 [Sphingobacteriales bacterium]|nr:MAG: hypothetical protein EOP51_09965 [Sphingobacteriales bacterium]
MKMQNHSVFVAFAPVNDPKIAIAVIVENAGYGATWAGPVASLMMEKYLKDSVNSKRKFLEDKMYNAHLITKYTYIIDSADRLKARLRDERKMAQKRYEDSVARNRDSLWVRRWMTRTYISKQPKR